MSMLKLSRTLASAPVKMYSSAVTLYLTCKNGAASGVPEGFEPVLKSIFAINPKDKNLELGNVFNPFVKKSCHVTT